ncbi:exonuclease 3'-5' domain-containing protein 2 [Stomoxys calcitrans]|uniref:Exonuclease 3'-5' domain-containing protein 2 n=1 Tax=Stomoxys calcitrans TaxID=35570 RepID=A0A1I8PS54_STOCA|nr:exonuclease 3'-5' domain-containing protein 2 [Stomoxys calcitrans]
MANKGSEVSKRTLVAAAGLGLCVIVLATKRDRLLNYLKRIRDPLGHRRIEVVQNVDDCHRVVRELKEHCNKFKVLGFDCEWVTVGGTRRPTALLQLSSEKGLCALFRLCCIKQIPKSLRELLEDENVLKVGVDPNGDAKKLCHDYGVGVASTFDLRFLAAMTGRKPGGLANLSKAVLNVHLDKNWRIVCSDWEATELTKTQLHYAANDAMVAVEIFKILSKELFPRHFWQLFTKIDFEQILQRIDPFLEISFKEGYINSPLKKNTKLLAADTKKDANNTRKFQARRYTTRSKALYDNCLLEAPDGELLCTIDKRKAQWYVERNLGTEVNAEPYTVRLNFEPAGRAEGDVGKYYQTPKENQCVVCGHKEAYIRKNVVPREYRKHFPVVMKTHTSHDVLLLCHPCHQISNISDMKIRHKLSSMCDAPFTQEECSIKYKEVPELKKLRSAARALLYHGDKLNEARHRELESVVLDYYKEEPKVTLELLQLSAEIDTKSSNENYCNHGEKVVQMFQTKLGGLIELEKIWRVHFLQTMQPKFLPTLWDVNHNANRLEIRANEGRVDKADLKLAGLASDVEI